LAYALGDIATYGIATVAAAAAEDFFRKLRRVSALDSRELLFSFMWFIGRVFNPDNFRTARRQGKRPNLE
jgi:hypothetical protein